MEEKLNQIENDYNTFVKFFSETPIEELIDLLKSPEEEILFNYNFADFIKLLYYRANSINDQI